MTPVKIRNRAGHLLFGILHHGGSRAARLKPCIVFLSPGVKSRVAPHRLYVQMAQLFAAAEYDVLRFDFSGLGDSEGENEEQELVDLYNAIQLGKYVGDTVDVMDWLERQHGHRHFILAGLCGGAITGLHTGAQDSRVVGLLAIGIPVVFDGNSIDKRLFLTSRYLEYNRARFLQKAFNWAAWKRLLFLKSDFRLLYLSFMTPALKKVRGQSKSESGVAPADSTGDLNPLFHPHFMDFAKNRKILLVFGESDKLLWDFQEKYLGRHRSSYDKVKKNIKLRIIPKANHILSFREWTGEMLEISKEWLQGNFDPAGEIRAVGFKHAM